MAIQMAMPIMNRFSVRETKLAMVADKAKLAFYVPGVAPEDRRHLWGPAFDTPQQAVDEMLSRLPRDARVVVIPEGPYVFSQVAGTPVGVG